MNKYKILEELTRFSSPSGREENIRNYVIEQIKDYVDELYIDKIGNIIAKKNSSNNSNISVGFLAHMDEVFLVITKISNNKAFFCNMSKINVNYLIGKKVKFSNGTFGVVQTDVKINNSDINSDDLYIDISGNNTINIGDFATFIDNYMENNNYVYSKSLDNRAGCYALIKEIMQNKKSKNNIYYVFTVQEELGARGASNILSNFKLDYGFSVDVTSIPKNQKNYNIDINKGVALKICDGGIISNHILNEKIINACDSNNIKYQLEILPFGSTDVSTLNLYNSGIICSGLSVPCRYVHSCNELICMDDVDMLIKLINLICNMDLEENKNVVIK